MTIKNLQLSMFLFLLIIPISAFGQTEMNDPFDLTLKNGLNKDVNILIEFGQDGGFQAFIDSLNVNPIYTEWKASNSGLSENDMLPTFLSKIINELNGKAKYSTDYPVSYTPIPGTTGSIMANSTTIFLNIYYEGRNELGNLIQDRMSCYSRASGGDIKSDCW